MLFEAFKLADVEDLKLVIAGQKGWLYRDMFARLQTLGLEQQVIFTGHVPDQDLPAVYSCAEAFAFPSLYEGFGLPVLEAMACGTPVISSNTSSLPEVAGDAALLVAPDDVRRLGASDHTTGPRRLTASQLSERGLRQAKRFTWQAAAQQTRALCRISMSIVLDARTATDHFPGIGRYVVNLAQALASWRPTWVSPCCTIRRRRRA